MMVMMMAMTPSLNASSLPVFIAIPSESNSLTSVMLEMRRPRDESLLDVEYPMTRPYITLLTASLLGSMQIAGALAEINTTHDHGSTEAAKAIQGWALTAGFPANDVVLIAPEGHPTKGNVIV